MVDISIIIVTYNSGFYIGNCLDSLSSQTDRGFDVIIIDNNSADKTVEIIKKKLFQCHLITNGENLGFAKGVNQGIKYSKSKFILTLNSDIALENNFIMVLKESLSSLPANIGMISPKILSVDKQHIDSTGLMLSGMIRFYDRGRGFIDLGQFDDKPDIFGPCAASAIYRREMLEEIKTDNEYFDEDFFMILEDFDIAWRAWKLGWRAKFLPRLVSYHYGGISRSGSSLCQYYSFRNRYLLLLKNAGPSVIIKFLLLIPVYEIPRLMFLLKVNNNTVRALKEVRGLSMKMLKKRCIAEKDGVNA